MAQPIHHPRVESVLIATYAFPRRDLFRPRRQLGIGRDNAHLLLPGIDVLTHLVPPLVELALEPGDPLLGRVVWGVGRASHRL